MADLKNIFVPITKVDEAKRLVYGVAAVEEVDKSREIFDYVSSKPLFEGWSATAQKSSGGKSFGNVRAMHGKVAAGRLDQIAFNDDDRQIEVCAKIVDDNEWIKCQEGVYTGFSIGGSYEKRWKDGDNTRYTASPTEVSLVDNPCQDSARFSMVKADGQVVEKAFSHRETPSMPASNDQVAARARELAKAAGDEARWPSFVEAASSELNPVDPPAVEKAADPAVVAAFVPTTRHPEPGLEQVWKAVDGTFYPNKGEAKARNDAIAKAEQPAAQLAAALGDLSTSLEKAERKDADPKDKKDADPKDKKDADPKDKKDADPKDKKDADPKDKKVWEKRADGDLAKSLYTVASLANMLDSIRCMAQGVASEQFYEGQMDSAQVAQLKAWLEQGGQLLVALVTEEVAEIGKHDAGDLEKAASGVRDHGALVKGFPGPVADALAKAGARNSKADLDKIQKMHDASVELGASCSSDDAEKRAGGSLEKLASVTAERDDLAKAVGEALPLIKGMSARLQALEDQPLPRPGEVARYTVVDKSADDANAAARSVSQTLADNPDAIAAALIKLSQSRPLSVSDRRG